MHCKEVTMKKYILSSILVVLFVTFAFFAHAQTSPCETAVPDTACTNAQMNIAPSSVVMCFTALDVSSDYGTSWDNVFTAAEGVELDIADLGDGADLSGVSGVTSGTLSQSTAYECARATVTRVIYTPTGGEVCNALTTLEAEGIDFTAMYIRGSDDCPGSASYPPFTPFETDDTGEIALRFNVELSMGGPKFLLIPTSGGSIDTSNAGYVELTASNASEEATGGFYCGIFKSTEGAQGPDAGGGAGTVDGTTATCTVGVAVGDYNSVGAFQDVDGSGPESGPNTGDMVCSTDEFSVTAGNTTEVTCDLVENP